MDIFTISDLGLGTPHKDSPMDEGISPDQHSLLESEWRRRVGEGALVLIPGGISSNTGQALLQDLEWLDSLPGSKVVTPGSFDQWGDQDEALALMQNFSSIEPLIGDAIRMPGLKPGGHGVVVTAMLGHPITRAEGADIDAYATELKRVLEVAKPLHKGRDVRALMCVYDPFMLHQTPSELTKLIDDANMDICVYGSLHTPIEWKLAYQGRCGKYQHQGPDYRLATAAFLGWSPTRAGICDHNGWWRKEREREPEIEWKLTSTANAPRREFAALQIEYAPARSESLYQLPPCSVDTKPAVSSNESSPVGVHGCQTLDDVYDKFLEYLERDSRKTVGNWRKQLSGAYKWWAHFLDHYPDETVLADILEHEKTTPSWLPADATDDAATQYNRWLQDLRSLDDQLQVAEIRDTLPTMYARGEEWLNLYPGDATVSEILMYERVCPSQEDVDTSELDQQEYDAFLRVAYAYAETSIAEFRNARPAWAERIEPFTRRYPSTTTFQAVLEAEDSSPSYTESQGLRQIPSVLDSSNTRWLTALEDCNKHLTMQQIKTSKANFYKEYQAFFTAFKPNTTVEEMLRSNSSSPEVHDDAWQETLSVLDGELTVAEIKKQLPETYLMWVERFARYCAETTIDTISEQEITDNTGARGAPLPKEARDMPAAIEAVRSVKCSGRSLIAVERELAATAVRFS